MSNNTIVNKLIAEIMRSPTYVSSLDAGHGEAGIVISPDPVGGGLILYSDTDTYDPELATGTYQVLMKLADGKIYAGAGAVIIDDDGITLTNGTGTTNKVKWISDLSVVSGVIYTATTGGANQLLIGGVGTELGVSDYGQVRLLPVGQDGISSAADFLLSAGLGTGALTITTGFTRFYMDSTRYALFHTTLDGGQTFLGLGVGSMVNSFTPSSLLHLKSTAPTFRMEDSTGSANSLLLTVDANDAIFKEVSGSALLTLELDNSLVIMGSGTITGAAPAGSLVSGRYNGSTNTDHLVATFVGNWTGTTGASMQGVEGYVTTNHASGAVTNVLGVIGHGEAIGAGTVTNMVAFESSNITNTGAGLITNSYNFRASPFVRVGGGSATNTYAFYADTMTSTGVTNKWAFYSAGTSDKSYFAGSVGIGSGATSPAETLEVNTSTNNTGMRVVFTGTSSSSVGPQIAVYTNDGAAVASADRIGQIAFGGYNGSAIVNGPFIIATTTELWSGTARGSKMTFYTVPNTTTSITAAMTLNQDQSASFVNSIKSTSPTAGIGYATGAGGTVTQATSKSTGVTLDTVCGTVTMNNAALAADTVVSFVLTNAAIAATDVLILNHVSAGTAGAYTLNARRAAGSATIDVRNVTAGSLSEAIVIGFVVIKGVTA